MRLKKKKRLTKKPTQELSLLDLPTDSYPSPWMSFSIERGWNKNCQETRLEEIWKDLAKQNEDEFDTAVHIVILLCNGNFHHQFLKTKLWRWNSYSESLAGVFISMNDEYLRNTWYSRVHITIPCCSNSVRPLLSINEPNMKLNAVPRAVIPTDPRGWVTAEWVIYNTTRSWHR